MQGAREESPSGDDREAWDRAWGEMPHRRLLEPPRISLGDWPWRGLGPAVSFTISGDPAPYQDRAWRVSERCAICGEGTTAADRLAASLHPVWANRLTVGLGVWVHHACFARCPEAGSPAPIPW